MSERGDGGVPEFDVSELESMRTLLLATRSFLHEINNLLHLGWGSTQALQRRPERSAEWLEVLQKTMQRGRHSVAAFQPFVRGVWPERAVIDVRDLAQWSCELLRPTFPRPIELRCEMDALEVELVFADFLHVLFCMLSEASDAVAESHDGLRLQLRREGQRAQVAVSLPEGVSELPVLSGRLRRAVERMGGALNVLPGTGLVLELPMCEAERELLLLLVGAGAQLRQGLEGLGVAVLEPRTGESWRPLLNDYLEELDALLFLGEPAEQLVIQAAAVERGGSPALLWAGEREQRAMGWQWVEPSANSVMALLRRERR